ncbi:hypothetical protein C7B65_06915 [Phormidesmis priestleyi ULC007]|uniref:Uncharacterized protein n=1 Tax=Phormidesmis priestleyi ULC007 TaxID=1920490 RepID=A0A2T1DJF7_9CYAN|nr:hypothetical protein [Phormidesmis priestleyi]PSB20629.1 hypothetical protein C7B65_06915 [Phormidesmis priestleyi ULC007]PZO54299.1 MAG: hypothetical protein DCF14_02560 [Phormidesmis priestleyi]
MTLEEKINQQRVKHIVSSYQLEGKETEAFADYLEELLQTYAMPLLELALAETLIVNWMNVPMQKGILFLQQTHDRLKNWETHSISSSLTPQEFQQITGLDPSPIFGTSEFPPPSIARSC